MSSNDRPATKAFKDRWNNLLAFWRERKRGVYDKDFTEWRIDMGLTPRTAKENYWDAGQTLGIIRIVFEKKQKWEFCDSTSDKEEEIKPKRKLTKAGKFFKNCRIKDEMKAGPCKGQECPPFTDEAEDGCRWCLAFVNLENKDFLKLKEEE